MKSAPCIDLEHIQRQSIDSARAFVGCDLEHIGRAWTASQAQDANGFDDELVNTFIKVYACTFQAALMSRER